MTGNVVSNNGGNNDIFITADWKVIGEHESWIFCFCIQCILKIRLMDLKSKGITSITVMQCNNANLWHWQTMWLFAAFFFASHYKFLVSRFSSLQTLCLLISDLPTDKKYSHKWNYFDLVMELKLKLFLDLLRFFSLFFWYWFAVFLKFLSNCVRRCRKFNSFF